MTNFATVDQARQSLSAAGFKVFTKGIGRGLQAIVTILLRKSAIRIDPGAVSHPTTVPELAE